MHVRPLGFSYILRIPKKVVKKCEKSQGLTYINLDNYVTYVIIRQHMANVDLYEAHTILTE